MKSLRIARRPVTRSRLPQSSTPSGRRIPHTSRTSVGSPTGIAFNGSNDFAVATGMPGIFIFVSLDGTISAWNPGVNLNNAIQKVPGSTASVLTGATIAQIGDDRFLYVADIRQGKIAVYDTNFNPVEFGKHAFVEEHGEHAFDDEDVPKGFVPFNVQNIGNNLYVAFAQQNQAKNFVVFGAGLGFCGCVLPKGRLLMRLEHGDWFNAPWGLTLGEHFKLGATRPSSEFASPVQFAFPDTNERRSPSAGH